MVRPANIHDYDDALELARLAHESSPYRDTKMNEAHIKRLFCLLTSMPNMYCYVAEHKGMVVGILGGHIALNSWGIKVAADLITYAERDTDKLILGFVKWAKEKDAEYVHITQLSSNPRYGSMLEKLHFKRAGQCFAMEI